MADENRLGAFLRARRDQVRPADVGLAVDGRRRVPGLRRDELADLAGVSVDYYVRLERGRDRHPSPQVLDALARVLRLDADARRHLHALARPEPAPRPTPVDDVPDGLAHVVATWPGPATLSDHRGVVLAANELARALSPAHEPGADAYRMVFLDPALRRLYGEDWERVAADVVAGLRATAGIAPDDPALVELIGELTIRSPEFARLWGQFEVRPRGGRGVSRLTHPVVGPVALRWEKLAVTDHAGLTLVLFSPASDVDAEALARLAGVAGGVR